MVFYTYSFKRTFFNLTTIIHEEFFIHLYSIPVFESKKIYKTKPKKASLKAHSK
jgi:hypothetical protein